MSRLKPLFVCALALSCALAPVVSAASTRDASVATAASGAAGTADPDTWIGAAAAIGCGFFARATIATGGTVVATWAGGIASCGLMIFDALFIDKNDRKK